MLVCSNLKMGRLMVKKLLSFFIQFKLRLPKLHVKGLAHSPLQVTNLQWINECHV